MPSAPMAQTLMLRLIVGTIRWPADDAIAMECTSAAPELLMPIRPIGQLQRLLVGGPRLGATLCGRACPGSASAVEITLAVASSSG